MLHMVFSSPFQNRSLQQCEAQLLPGDEVLLLQDAVVAAVSPNLLDGFSAQGVSVYALASDLMARGLAARVSEAVTVIDHQEFVELTVRHPNSLKWA
ncbi:sulfurtransferase complex subunit TusB [Photobacterium sp. GJ3]|uniref:sulfurtransferase complex subunit TusB n=1 Tax=Photobacterium sp. GJ3 TaxID=2829502 RepID=UPI001B8AD603|nr:sulfurtransferase complex subunit TusB [Photobacterium sp. GJ3]QUJ67203.1 sulfurtransferase complex subunit TusB [Photobacterium sp. GJ3]